MSSNGEDDPTAFEAALGRVLTARIPDVLALRTAERLSGGASQETYRLTVETPNGQRHLALRRAVGGVVDEASTAPGLAVEARLMQEARAVGVPEPEVLHVLRPEDGLGAGFVMEWLDGETLGARIVRSSELADVRPRLAYQCGEILARIHAIDLDATGLRAHLQTMTSEEFVRQMWDRYREFGTPQPMIDYAARWLLDHLPDDVDPRLVHNDFRNGNLMVGPRGVIAVLDWEVAHIGDPMRDLGWLCTNSWRFGGDLPVGGFGRREDLFAGYEAVSGAPVDPERVRFWEVFGSYWWAIGCLTMAERYRTGPDRTVERPGIGRRSSECQVDCVNLLIPGPVTLIDGAPLAGVTDMPSMDELLGSVTDFLRDDVMAATAGRINFLARVASNSLDIVRRELAIGPELRARETQHLQTMFTSSDDLGVLKWRLVDALRDGSMALDHPGLVDYLREAVVNQVAIDQPRYSGYQLAASRAADG
jgi:aminoglycoside phosphotransferase (APT) family kinase protein